MRLHVVKAAEGDGLLLESGDAKPRRLLIDGGPRGCWDADMRPYLQDVIGREGRLDALLLSHVDNDHVLAPLDLLADLERQRVDDPGATRWPTVADLWHNSFERTLEGPDARILKTLSALRVRAAAAGVSAAGTDWVLQGIGEGARLRRDALRERIPLNDAFGGRLISPDELEDPVVSMGAMTLRVIGPTRKNLEALRRKWLDWAAEAARKKSAQDLANIDRSVPNLSSVVLLAEEAGRTILLTGDARGDHIEQGLDQAGLRDGGRIHVNVLKLQHHGSARNVERRFFDAVTADVYVVSANGRDDNPDIQTMTWVVEAAREQGREVRLVATYDTPSLRTLRETHPPAPGWYGIELPAEAGHAVVVDV